MPQSKIEPRRFDVGAVVMARWPKSSLFFKGTILDYNDIEYLVKLDDEDESELAIKFKDVQLPFTRSRSRSRGRTPSKSPSRRKSPSRGSSNKLPQSRRSPGRQPKSDNSPEGGSSSRSRERKEKFRTERREEKTSTNNLSKTTTTATSTRHSSRIASFQKSDAVENRLMTDEKSRNNSITVDTKSVVKSVEERSRILTELKRIIFCLYFSAKFILLASVMVFLPFIINSICSTMKCEVKPPNLTRNLSWYWNAKSVYVASAYIASIFILTLIPIGKCLKMKTGSKIRCNGYVSLIALCVAVGFLKSQYKLADNPILNQQLFFAFGMYGVLLSCLLYIKSFYARRADLNPHGKTGYYLVDFIEGREICPRIASFDLKFFLFRLSILLIITLNVVVVIKGLERDSDRFSPTLLVSSGLQVFYALDFILFEDSFTTTYEYLNQGMGFITCVGYLTFPFMFAVYSRYVLSYRFELPWYCLLGVVTMYLIGYTIFRGANSQKHAYRTNPANPALVHLESLPTATGSRLLVSGWWGLVRHPNYLGDMIIQLSWAILCGFSGGIPWIVTAFSLLYLVVRVFIVEKQCKAKYGLAWSSYTARVPYRIIPKVF